MNKFNYSFIAFMILTMHTFGQESQQDLYDLSLEELMNLQIVSASKKSESAFESPLSSTVLTRDEIIASGATTIEEALRLVPGLLIREETSGNFDVHIRGNDNLPPGNFAFYSENSMSLVMIDGRPVYNYANGGTFWETLPISIVDVERIEVVRGPATALYGPNAVTGAVNIITRKPAEKSIGVHGSAQLGNKKTSIIDLSLGTSLIENKLKLRVSGNLESRDRDMETYYSFVQGFNVNSEEVVNYTTGAPYDNFPDPQKSKDRKAFNAFIDYEVNENLQLHLSGGLQDSYAQSVFNEQTSVILSNRSSESNYIDFRADVHGFTAQVSHNTGTQNISAGTESQNSMFDFSISSANLEYDINLGTLTLRPGINYQNANYSDIPYVGETGNGYLNADRKLSNIGYFLRADYRLLPKLRLIAAVRNDHYNVPDDNYLSYQFISTYNFSDNHMVRALYSRANRGPFMIDAYVDYSTGNGITSPYVEYAGSENLDMPVMNMIEVGYRGVLSSVLTLDVELFHAVTSDITSFEPTYLAFDSYGLHVMYEYLALDLKARQTAATLSLNIAPSSKIQLKAYATVQQTALEDYDKKLSPVIIDPANMIFSLPETERMNTIHNQTPAVYGGLTGNFRPLDQLNLFAGVYYLGAHTYRHDYASYEESKGEVEVPGKAVVTLKASYNFYKNNSVFINARNLLNSQASEFGFSDEIGGLYLAGINLSF